MVKLNLNNGKVLKVAQQNAKALRNGSFGIHMRGWRRRQQHLLRGAPLCNCISFCMFVCVCVGAHECVYALKY